MAFSSGEATYSIFEPQSNSHNPMLVARGHGEVQFNLEVVDVQSPRTALVPWATAKAAGAERLQQLFQA